MELRTHDPSTSSTLDERIILTKKIKNLLKIYIYFY